MIKNHWLLGAGLGAFVKQELMQKTNFLVIHNTFIWLWAECGLLAIASFVGYGLLVLQKAWAAFQKKQSSSPFITLFALFIVFVGVGSFHDMWNQRIFWLIFGLYSISYSRKNREMFS